MKLRDANLQLTKRSSFTHRPSCILLSFSQNTSSLLLPKRFWKCVNTTSFRRCKEKVVLLVIYLFNYNSSKSTFFMLNYGICRSLEQFLSNKLEFFVSCNNVKITRTSFLCGPLFSIMVIKIFYFDIYDKLTLSTMSTVKKW